eukprot:CAMPEP_0181211258 /NCGR_PEP_ID=MMETSP1096-20121128/23685_1 /TAXON_ID=156174 ORGANISM="Chrysochromulina ericina, Strain CCMP281" /NCGR_SAMPLE_ID=MMETSP1096 /ASSEMBLY_ACC=CAM_ASM_000453 /LENGTH=118 /DNA_ID=CAMNT_0023302637 /DNA_START=448 /DNA_END=804 /DNA_ORIENTATION=-
MAPPALFARPTPCASAQSGWPAMRSLRAWSQAHSASPTEESLLHKHASAPVPRARALARSGASSDACGVSGRRNRSPMACRPAAVSAPARQASASASLAALQADRRGTRMSPPKRLAL